MKAQVVPVSLALWVPVVSGSGKDQNVESVVGGPWFGRPAPSFSRYTFLYSNLHHGLPLKLIFQISSSLGCPRVHAEPAHP